MVDDGNDYNGFDGDDDDDDEEANDEEKALIPKELNCQVAPRSLTEQ